MELALNDVSAFLWAWADGINDCDGTKCLVNCC